MFSSSLKDLHQRLTGTSCCQETFEKITNPRPWNRFLLLWVQLICNILLVDNRGAGAARSARLPNHHGELLISAFAGPLNQPRMDSGKRVTCPQGLWRFAVPEWKSRTSYTRRSYGVKECSKSQRFFCKILYFIVWRMIRSSQPRSSPDHKTVSLTFGQNWYNHGNRDMLEKGKRELRQDCQSSGNIKLILSDDLLKNM